MWGSQHGSIIPAALKAEPGAVVASAARAFVVVAAYVALEWLTHLHEHKSIPVTPWNPGLGLVFGLMVLRGMGYAALLAVGTLLSLIFIQRVDLPLPLIAALSICSGVGYGAVAHWLRRDRAFSISLTRLRDVVSLLLAGVCSALLVAVTLAGLMVIDDDIDASDVLVTFAPMFVGDAIGIAVFAPIVLRIASHIDAHDMRRLLPAAELVAISGFVLVVVALLEASLGPLGLRYVYALFVPIVLAAVRHGIDGACISLAVAQFALIVILHVTGHDARSFTEVQAQMLVLTITGLIVGVVVSERQALAREAQQAAARVRKLEQEAGQAERFSLAGGMASAIAHEINQPITAARALGRSVQHLVRTPPADLIRAERNLKDMIAQIDHAADIVRRMRDFLQRGRPHISTIDIDTMVRNATDLVRTEAETDGIEMIVDCAADLAPMFGDRTQIEQVLINLIRNSIEALRGARVLAPRITVSAKRGEEPQTTVFTVQDNGPGVPKDLAEKLFEPLSSTKPDGLGLGLAISASIVQTHHGRVWLASADAGQTAFSFLLPNDAGGQE